MLDKIPNSVMLVTAIAILAIANGRQLAGLAASVSARVRQWFPFRPLPHPDSGEDSQQLERLLAVRAWATKAGKEELAQSVNESLRILLEVGDS